MEFDYRTICLETGIWQPEAQQLCESVGFQRMVALGPYVGNSTSVCFEKDVSDSRRSPESVVQRQLDAYNACDVEGLVVTYAEDVQQLEYPATLLASCSAQLRQRITARFKEPNLHARLIRRIVMGQVVIDHEEVSRTFPEGTGKLELVAIYEVRDGKIVIARFINGAKTLDSNPSALAGEGPSTTRGSTLEPVRTAPPCCSAISRTNPCAKSARASARPTTPRKSACAAPWNASANSLRQ